MKKIKTKEDIKKIKCFDKWYRLKVKEEKALINQVIAGKLLGVSRQAINNMLAKEELHKISFDNLTFLSLKEVSLKQSDQCLMH